MSDSNINVNDILNNSEVLYSQDKIEARIKEMSQEISEHIGKDVPLFLNVMNGSVFFFAELLKHMKAPLTIDYVQATRYNNSTTGSKDLSWLHKPDLDIIKDKDIYVIDDILDEGQTLLAVKNFLLANGAKSCKIAVLVDKITGAEKPLSADFVGFQAPNKYLFGFGMDIFGLYRQLPYLLIYNNR